MLLRLIIVVILLAAGVFAYRWFIRRQITRTAALAFGDPLLRNIKPGVPTILYFTTPACIPCQTQQTPALARLQNELGESGVQVVKIDAAEQPEMAQRWGVFSSPTTFVIDGCGETLAVNYGVADAAKLRRQLSGAASITM